MAGIPCLLSSTTMFHHGCWKITMFHGEIRLNQHESIWIHMNQWPCLAKSPLKKKTHESPLIHVNPQKKSASIEESTSSTWAILVSISRAFGPWSLCSALSSPWNCWSVAMATWGLMRPIFRVGMIWFKNGWYLTKHSTFWWEKASETRGWNGDIILIILNLQKMDMIYLCLGFLRTLSLGGSAMYASSCISKILLQWLQKDLLQ